MGDFGALLSGLNGAGVRFVIVGGIAVIRHGVVRATKNLDVLVGLDDATEAALGPLMMKWEATRPDGSPEDRRLPSAGWPLHLRTVHGLLDVLAEQGPPLDLAGLLSRSDTRRVDGVEAPICSLSDLVVMKQRARRSTDLEALSHLETAHGELPRPRPSIRAMLDIGTQAPDFTLPDQDGNPVTLSDLRGHSVVVYFYPKADTPGCTTQACSIRDRRDEYEAAGVRVLGISPDPVKRVKKFHEGKSLNFTLLADEDHAVCEEWGVWTEKSMYGKKYWGAARATFILDGDGKIVHVIPKASPKTHDDEVLAALAAA